MNQQIELRKLPKNELFKKKNDQRLGNVLMINHYDRSLKKYSCSYFFDMNKEIFLKPSTLVYIGFEF